MGSGPMRAAYAHEPLFAELGLGRAQPTPSSGSWKGASRRPRAVFAKVAEACRVAPSAVTLLIAPTASLAGGVAGRRPVGRDRLAQAPRAEVRPPTVVSAHGVAPLPPVAKDDLAAIGRTNDAILYGARVVLT